MRNNPVQITRNSTASIEPFQTAETIHLSEDEIKLFDMLACVLEYPTDDWFEQFEKCQDLVRAVDGFGSVYFSEFCLEIREFSLLELQESYTHTFDLNPVCALEVGYHLFGEDYKRGEFLARLRQTENPFQLGQEQQLPDYLPVVLRLLGQMEDAEERAAMIGYCLIPALKMMSTALEKKRNPYGNMIKFLLGTLKQIAEQSVSDDEEKKEKEAGYQYA